MKKFLIPFYDLGLGGVQTKIIDIANYLSKQKNTDVLLVIGRKSGFNRSVFLNKKVRIVYIPEIAPNILHGRYHYALLILILLYRPSCMFISLERTTVIAMRFLEMVRFIDTRIIINMDVYLKLEQIYPTLILNKYLNRSSMIIAPSRAIYKDLLERIKIKSSLLRYIPNWANPISIRSRDKDLNFIFAGRLTCQKNPLVCIDFVRKLHGAGIKCSLSIYGEGELLPNIQELIKKYKLEQYITIYNPIENIGVILSKAQFLLIPSKYEGLPFIALEAMSNGTVVVGLNSPGTNEVVIDGKTGICKRTVSELAKEAANVINEPRKYQNLQVNAYRYVKLKYGFQNMIKIAHLLLK